MIDEPELEGIDDGQAHPGPGGDPLTRDPVEESEIAGPDDHQDNRPPVPFEDHGPIARALREAVEEALELDGGRLSMSSPTLAGASPERLGAAVTLYDGTCLTAGEGRGHAFTLQSAAKVVLLAGLLDELGEERVFEVVGTEASGDRYDSVLQLALQGPKPANPLVNAGAIALCDLLNGVCSDPHGWIESWAERLCGQRVGIDETGLEYELRTNHINRAMTHLMGASEVLRGDPEEAQRSYYRLCSVETDVVGTAHLAAILARGGTMSDHSRVLHVRTVEIVVSLMAVCGMYNDSGSHLMSVGVPAKSGVSGVILAVAPGRAGISAYSPPLGPLGTSVRGQYVLRHLSRALRWHFAHPDG